jgi:hypothetical protein
MLILYIDYMLIVSKNYKDKLSLLKKNLSETFDMKDLGDDDIFFVCILLVIGLNDTSICLTLTTYLKYSIGFTSSLHNNTQSYLVCPG